ncbi:transcriptional regulator [Amycolatopsis pittospori]|uniref:transcriptional regulator n=1 Tax=Amycolatopsis pittospori TaxID=2749434 RepID=UPI0015F05E47|nr:transcriptional regulator [Amycolatopsis pittospori]
MFGIDRTPNSMEHMLVDPLQRARNALDALTSAVGSLGLSTRQGDVDAPPGRDLVIAFPDGREVGLQVKTVALITTDSLPGLLRRWSTSEIEGGSVVVADRITAEARSTLNQAGWGWLDLRGHLRLTGPGLFIDSDVPVLVGPETDRQGIIGRVGIELAALLLLDPARRIGVRAAAAALSRAPSSISETFAALRGAGLVDEDNKPVLPALFWELAEHWKPVSRDVASVPAPDGGRENAALRLGMDDVESNVGWALTDTVAAAAYGAPVSIRADHPPDFYVPDQGTLRRSVQLLGTATTATMRAGRVRIAPVPLVCARRIDATEWSDEKWPLANPLFVALDLAQDPGRGAEILDGWTPETVGARVW